MSGLRLPRRPSATGLRRGTVALAITSAMLVAGCSTSPTEPPTEPPSLTATASSSLPAMPLLPRPTALPASLLDGHLFAAALQGDRAYLAVGTQLAVLDLTVPGTPEVVGITPPLDRSLGAIVVGEGVVYGVTALTQGYASDDPAGGLRVIDVRQPGAPRLVGRLDTPGSNIDLTAIDDLVLIADGTRGLRMIDASDPSAPIEMHTHAIDAVSKGVTAADGLAYVASAYRHEGASDVLEAVGEGGLHVIDVRQPTAPTALAYLESWSEWSSADLALHDGTLFGFTEYLRVLPLDVRDPRSPREIPSSGYDEIYDEDRGPIPEGFVFARDHLYITHGRCEGGPYPCDLTAIDVRDARSPLLRATVPSPGASPLATDGNRLLVGGPERLVIFDLADPAAPRVAGTLDHGSVDGPPAPRWPPRSYDLEDVTITLQRHWCPAECPELELRIEGDGRFVYEGTRYVAEIGRREGRVDHEALGLLVDDIYDARFFDMRPSYVARIDVLVDESTGRVIERWRHDDRSLHLTLGVQIGEQYKRVLAKTDAPAALVALAEKIEAAVGVRHEGAR